MPLKLNLNIPKGIEHGELLGSGLCGDVRRDVDNKGFVLKNFLLNKNHIFNK